jgi:hypothetical protein
MCKYLVEVKRGCNDTDIFYWWGPLNNDKKLIRELKQEGYTPIAFWEANVVGGCP